VFWCFSNFGDNWDLNKTCEVAKQIGCGSIELLGPDEWPTLFEHGLTCAIAANGMPGAPFKKGLNNLKFHEEIIETTKKRIDACGESGIKRVIAFNGYKWNDPEDPKSGEISLEDGAKNCVKGLKELAAYGKKKGVTVCIEHLNTRDDSDPNKGHPGYQGDDIDYVANIVREVGSDHCKVLFDVYHVQVMNGDVVRRIGECKDVIGHIHVAGNPGRGNLDETQEINYPAVMRKLVEIGYDGWIGQEFMPVGDPYHALHHAVQLCDV